MKIAILNWSSGENNPFTPFNEKLKHEFEAFGREVVLIPLNSSFPKNLIEAHKEGLDFAITWQGLGTGFSQASVNQCIWDQLRLPLFCIHGDHPSQQPDNHLAFAKYARHFYAAGSFTRYANRHFQRKHAALTFKMPVVNKKTISKKNDGDFFVVLKNLDDTAVTFKNWQSRVPADLLKILIECATAITENMQRESQTDHHFIVDKVLENEKFFSNLPDRYSSLNSHSLYHWIHNELNKLYRNIFSEIILSELKDFPVKIIGRGWERHAAKGNPRHSFHAALNAADSEEFFYSRWGIIDVSPTYDCLHDRTLRAISCKSSFLSGSNWPHAPLISFFSNDLLFNSNIGHLKERAEAVVSDPELHFEKCLDFGKNYQVWAPHSELLRNFELFRSTFN